MKQLTPVQRAAIQLFESLLITGFIAGAVAIIPLLNGPSDIHWPQILFLFLFAFLFSLGHGIAAYLKPAQPDLSAALEAILDALERRYQHEQPPPPTLPPAHG